MRPNAIKYVMDLATSRKPKPVEAAHEPAPDVVTEEPAPKPKRRMAAE